jgi:hypothetical protein
MKTLTLTLAALFLSGCMVANDGTSGYVQEANAFCKVHSLEYWRETGQLEELNRLSPTEKQIRLIQEIRATVTSDEMAKIIYEDAKELHAKEFYPYLQERIPELTNEPFDCPAIEEFYVAD